MNDAVVRAAQDWLGEVLGANQHDDLARAWDQFAANPLPVLTLFGSYDTGKSAIVRRLLVDNGVEVPEWVTISARHETFEAREIEVHGYRLRDTPGISAHETDLRASANTREAMTAVALSDVVCIVVNPQLATAERDQLLKLLDQDWPAGALIFVISRFDEAGASPLYDLHGFADLANRKVAELRRSLSLSDQVVVHTAIPDFEQTAGTERNPDPSTWDEARHFDGMQALGATFGAVAEADLARLREGAAVRYWLGQVDRCLTQARSELNELEAAVSEAGAQQQRRDLLLAQLTAQANAAEVSLRGAVEEAIRSTMRRQAVDAAAITAAVDQVLDGWWLKESAELNRLLRDAGVQYDEQRERPAWHLLSDLYEPEAQTDDPAERPRKLTPKLEGIAGKATAAVQAMKSLRETAATGSRKRATQPSALPTPSTIPPVLKIEIAVQALPVLIELIGLLEDAHNDQQAANDRRQRREQLQEDVTRLANDAADTAIARWKPQLDSARELLHELSGDGPDDLELLKEHAAQACERVAQGQQILDRERLAAG